MFTARGAERSTGLWGKTPQYDLEAASQWWVATSVQSANKKDLVRNPADRTETHLLCYNYEGKREKHLNFAAAMQRQQLVDWASEVLPHRASWRPPTLVILLLCHSARQRHRSSCTFRSTKSGCFLLPSWGAMWWRLKRSSAAWLRRTTFGSSVYL